MGALFKNPKHLAFRISHPNQETGGGKVKLRLGHSSMRALLLLSLALCASPARSARLRVQFRPQRASPAASGASNASFAALGACPAQISLVSGCVDASTLSEAGACVIGPDGEASNSSSIVEICGGGVMVDEVDGAVNASGRGIETVDEVGSSWTALCVGRFLSEEEDDVAEEENADGIFFWWSRDLSSNSLTGFDANATNATLLSLWVEENLWFCYLLLLMDVFVCGGAGTAGICRATRYRTSRRCRSPRRSRTCTTLKLWCEIVLLFWTEFARAGTHVYWQEYLAQ